MEQSHVWLMDPQMDTTNLCFYWKQRDALDAAEELLATDMEMTGRKHVWVWAHTPAAGEEPETLHLQITHMARPYRLRRKRRWWQRRRGPLQEFTYDFAQVKRYPVWNDSRLYDSPPS